MNLDPLIKACQRAIGATEDGKPGPETWAKIYKAITGKDWTLAPGGTQGLILGTVSARSESKIATLLLAVQPYARSLIHAASGQGIHIEVTSGTRTYEEQNALFEQGRSKPGRIVTNARGGYSNHNHGIAFDVTIFNGADPVWESPLYKVVGALGKSLGLTWGGDWQTISDEPHFELKPIWAKELSEGQMLSRLRDMRDAGVPVFA